MMKDNDSDSEQADFFRRGKDNQEAILLNLFCERCKRPAKTPTFPTEYMLQGIVWVEATCNRCGNRVRIDVSTVP
jgi:hypothetical protein